MAVKRLRLDEGELNVRSLVLCARLDLCGSLETRLRCVEMALARFGKPTEYRYRPSSTQAQSRQQHY